MSHHFYAWNQTQVLCKSRRRLTAHPFISLLQTYVYVCMFVGMCTCKTPRGQKRTSKPPAGVTGSCEPPYIGVANVTLTLCKNSRPCNCQAVLSGPAFIFFLLIIVKCGCVGRRQLWGQLLFLSTLLRCVC